MEVDVSLLPEIEGGPTRSINSPFPEGSQFTGENSLEGTVEGTVDCLRQKSIPPKGFEEMPCDALTTVVGKLEGVTGLGALNATSKRMKDLTASRLLSAQEEHKKIFQNKAR